MNTKVAKKNNKGFTLIELIVVIAIIAVLAAILAPQYLRYVEKSRISADASTANEIKSAVQTACANDDVYSSLSTDAAGTTITWTSSGNVNSALTISPSNTKLQTELSNTLKDIPAKKSKKWQAGTYSVTVKVDTTNSTVDLTEVKPS